VVASNLDAFLSDTASVLFVSVIVAVLLAFMGIAVWERHVMMPKFMSDGFSESYACRKTRAEDVQKEDKS
jgi:23S rRNA maturation mini-RNase III